MSKAIIFCADGTWNGSKDPGKASLIDDVMDAVGKGEEGHATNVLKLFGNLAGNVTDETRDLKNEVEKVVEEGGAGAFLGGEVRFYLDQALTAAGAQVEVREPFKSHVVVDRELISAQQPASDAAFTQALLDALQKSQPNGPVARD